VQADVPADTTNPRSPADLFWSFSMLALQGFGGVMAVAQRELVDRKRWMTRQEFLGEWAVAQIMPGPNIINLALMLGDRHFGLRGALAGFAGMVTFPLVILLLIAMVFSSVEDIPAVQGGLRGMGGAVIGLIAANAIKDNPSAAAFATTAAAAASPVRANKPVGAKATPAARKRPVKRAAKPTPTSKSAPR
jgi:chromate transporter